MSTICTINDPNQRRFGKYLFTKLQELKSFNGKDLKDLTRKIYDEVLENTSNPSQALLYASMTPYWSAKLIGFNDSMRKQLKADMTVLYEEVDKIEADNDFSYLKEYLGIGAEVENIIKEQALQNNLEQSFKAQTRVKREIATIIKRKMVSRPTMWTTTGNEVDKNGNVIDSETFHYKALREVLNSMYNQPTVRRDGKLEASLPMVGPVFLKLVQLKEFAKTQKVKTTLPINDNDMVYAMVDKDMNYLSLNNDMEPVDPADGQTPYFPVMTQQDIAANEMDVKNSLSTMLFSTNVPVTYYELKSEQKKEIDLVYEREKKVLQEAIRYAKDNPGDGLEFDIVGGHFGNVISNKISAFKFDSKNPFVPQIDDSRSSSEGIITPQYFIYKGKKYYFEARPRDMDLGGIEEAHVNTIISLIMDDVVDENGKPLTVYQRRMALEKFIFTGIGLGTTNVLVDNGKDLYIEIKQGKVHIKTIYNPKAEFQGVEGQLDTNMTKLVSIDKLDDQSKRDLLYKLFRNLGYYQISKDGINNPDTFKWPYLNLNDDGKLELSFSEDVNYITWLESSPSFAITNPDKQMAINPFMVLQPTDESVEFMIKSDKNILKYADEINKRYVLEKSQEAERNAEFAKLEAEAGRHKTIPQKITNRRNIYDRVNPTTKKPLSSFELITLGLRTKTTRTLTEYIEYGTPKPGDVRWMTGYDNERILVRITDVYLTPDNVLLEKNKFDLRELSREEWLERNKKEAWVDPVNDKLSFNIEFQIITPESIKLKTPVAPVTAPSVDVKQATKEQKTEITNKMADVINPSAKKHLTKEKFKTKRATQFIGAGVSKSSTDNYMKLYDEYGLANTGQYNSSDVVFVSSNGNRSKRVNPVIKGVLQGAYKNIDTAISAGASFIMDTAAHLEDTKGYNLGEIALAEYLESKGYVREDKTGLWKPGKKEVKEPLKTSVTVVSQAYGVVVAETNPDKDLTEKIVDSLRPQIKKQAYKENSGANANDMFSFGLRWTRVKRAKKPLHNRSYANKGLISSDPKAKDGYVYDTVDQNGKKLPPISDLSLVIAQIEKTLGIDMSNYDTMLGNIYLPGQHISIHKDTTESLSARKYPVVVYTIGNNSGIAVYENEKQPGGPSFGSDKKTTIPTKDGTIYTFGMDGKGRFELAHDTPKNIKRDQKFPPITLPNGDVITNYTITLTFRRAGDLEPGMPDAPAKTGVSKVNTNIEQPTSETAPVRRVRPAVQPGPQEKGVDIENIIQKNKDQNNFKFKLKTLKGKEVTASVEQIEEAKRWYNNHPMSQWFKFSVGWNAANMKYKDDAGDAVALWTIDGIILLDGADHSDLYHEAWHGFSQTFLTQDERAKLYSEVSNYNGTFVDYQGNTVSFKDATEDQLEEYLAESFREYVLSKGTKLEKETPVKKNIFQRIYEWLKAFFGSSKMDEVINDPLSNPTVKKYFEDMRVGDLTDYSFNAKNRAYDKLAKGTIKPLAKTDRVAEALSYTQSKLILDTVDSIISRGIEIYNRNGANGRATVLFTKGENKLAAYRYVYNVFTDPENGIIANLNGDLADLRRKYNEAEKAEDKQRIQVSIDAKQSSIDLANWTVENFGNIEKLEENRTMQSGVIFQHMLSSEFISEEEKREFLEDIDEGKNTREPNQYGGSPQDRALQELASEDVLNLVRSMYQYDKNGKVIINDFGVPKLANFASTWNYVAKNLSGILDNDKMYDKLIDLSMTNPVMNQLRQRLGPFEARLSSDQEVDKVMFSLQTNFWQAFNKTRVPLVQLTFTEEEGETYSVTVGYATGETAKVKNNWNKAFGSQYTEFVKERAYDEEAEKKKTYVSPVQLDVNALIERFPSKPTTVERMLGFLNAIGINITDNAQVRAEMENSTPIKRSVSYTYDRIMDLYENGTPINFIGDMFRGITLKNDQVLEDQTHLLNNLADLEARFGDTVTNFMSSNAKGDTQFEHSLNSSLTRFIYEFNESNSQSELVNLAHMNHLDPRRNPFTRGSRSLWQHSMYDMSREGKRRVTADGKIVSMRFENMSGIKGINKFGEELGVKTSEADPVGKLLLDFHSFILRGTPEVVTHGDKTSTYSESVTRIYNPFAGSGTKTQNQRYIDDADFLVDESMSTLDKGTSDNRGYRLFYKVLSNYLYSEIQRMQICKDIVTNQKTNDLNFDYNYAKRGSDFVAFDDILMKDTKSALRKVLNTFTEDNIENKGLYFYEFLEDYYPEMSEMVERDVTRYFESQYDSVSKMINDAGFIDSKVTMSVRKNAQDKSKGNPEMKEEFKEVKSLDYNEAAIKSYVANSWIHNMETIINVYGDIAQYAVEKDEFHKRNSGFSSTGDIARTDRAAIDFVNSVGNAYTRSVTNEYGKPLADTFIEDDGSISTAVMEDTTHTATYYDEYYNIFYKYYLSKSKGDSQLAEEKTKKALKNYEGYKEGDGQAWVTFDMYRKLLILYGKWDWNDQERLYKDIVANKEVSMKDIAKFFPVKKFQYQGPLKGKGLPVMAMHKFSVMPLIPNIIKDTNLEKLHFRMMEKGIGYAMYKSASKVGTITDNSGKSDKFYTNENVDEFDRHGKFVRNQIFLHYLKDQLETGEEFKGKVTFPTQMRKLIIEGLVANGVPIDFGKGMSVEERIEKWEALSDKEKLKYPNYAKYKKYEDLIFELTEGKYMELLERINWKYDSKSKRPNGKIEDLVTYVLRNLEKQDVAAHELDFIQVHKGKLLIDMSVSFSAEQIEKLLNALVVKELIRQKIKGEPLIQVAKSGWEKPTDEQWAKYGEDLPFYRPGKGKNGKTSAMKIKIALQGDFKKLLSLDSVKKKAAERNVTPLEALNMLIRDEKELNKNDLRKMVTMIGCRIPTQGLNSMEFMEVYEFLPENAGHIIIMPREIVGKTGSDFDIDKMFTMMPHIYSKFGITKYVGYQKKSSATKRNQLNKREADLANQRTEIIDKYQDIFDRRDKRNEFAFNESERAQLDNLWAEYNEVKYEAIKKLRAAEKMERSLIRGSLNVDDAQKVDEMLDEARNELFMLQDSYMDNMYKMMKQFNKDRVIELFEKRNSELEPINREMVDIATEKLGSTTKGIENELMSTMRDILDSPENFMSMMRPNSTDIFDDLASEMAPYASEYDPKAVMNDEPVRLDDKGKPTISGTRIFEIGFNIYKRNTNSVGKAVLGIGAVENTYNVLYNRIGMYLNPTSGMSAEEYQRKRTRLDEANQELSNERNQKKPNTKLIRALKDEIVILKAETKNFSLQEIYLPHNSMTKNGKKVISLSDIYTVDGRHKIADIISQMINGWVDVARDQWIFNVQGNKEIAPTLLLMIEAGVPIEHAVYFVTQPLIRKYVERQREKRSVWAPALGRAPKAPSMFRYESRKEILDEYGIVPATHFEKENKETGEIELISYLDSRDLYDETRKQTDAFKKSWQDPQVFKNRLEDVRNNPEAEYTDFDKAVLLHFIELEDMAKASQKFKLTTNVDTSKARSLFEASAKEYAITDLKSEGRIPEEMIDRIAEDTAISSFFTALEYQQEIWSPYFKIRDSKEVKEFLHSVLRGPLRNELLENTFGTDAAGVQKFVQTFMNDLMTYLFQTRLYDFDMRTMQSFKGFNETSIATKKVVPLAYLEHGVFFEGNKMYIDRNQLAKDYQNLDKLTKEYQVAPVQQKMFPRENQYYKFVIEREYIRSTMPMQAVEKTNHYQNRLKALSNKQATLPEQTRKLMAYEETIRDIALMNTYNMAFMFNGNSNTSMGDILESIKAKHKDLRKQFEVLDSLTLFKHSGVSNIRLVDAPKDSDTLSLYNEQIKQLMNPDNLNIDATPEEKQFIANFFQKLPFFSLLQSGYDTNTSISMQRIMPWQGYVNLMSPVLKELTKEKNAKLFTENFMSDYFDRFMAQNSIDNAKERNRKKKYNTGPIRSYKEMLFPEDSQLTKFSIQSNPAISVSYDMNGRPIYRLSNPKPGEMEKHLNEIRTMIKENPNLVFVYNDVYDDNIGTPMNAAKQGDWVLKRLQGEFPENLIGLPTRRLYGTGVQSLIRDEDYDAFRKALYNRVETMKTAQNDKTLVFNRMGYGQALIGANDLNAMLPDKKPSDKNITPEAFDEVSEALLTNFGFLNPNYQDMEGIKAYQKKVITYQDIMDQINVCYTK